MEISFAIWLLRQSRGMSQAQLATRMRTTRQQVSDLEIGQLPTIPTLFRVARALQVSPACLVRIAEGRRRITNSKPIPHIPLPFKEVIADVLKVKAAGEEEAEKN
jgi:transcriptional regulator with XRE-family HTH domain